MGSNNEIILRIIDDFEKIIEKILEDKGTEEALNQIKRVYLKEKNLIVEN